MTERSRAGLLIIAVLTASTLHAQNEEIRKPKGGRETQQFVDEMNARESRKRQTPPVLRDRSLREALAAFDPATSRLEPLSLTIGEFITADNIPFVSIQVDMVADSRIRAGSDVRLIGIVRRAGEELASFDIKTRVDSCVDLRCVAASVILPSGSGLATIGVVLRGELVAATREAVDIVLPEPARRGISRLILAREIHPLETAQKPTDPFSFGGIRVVPHGSRSFSATGDMWLFCELRWPGLDSAGKPGIRMKIEVEGPAGDSSKVLRIPPVSVEASPLDGVPGHFGAGTTLDLQRFAPGRYAIRVTMIDSIDAASFQLNEVFTIESP